MRVLIGLVMLATAGTASAQAQGWRLTPDGYGAVRIGMTRPQVERALGSALRGEAIEDAAVCVEMQARRGHGGLVFMFENNRLSRISARAASRATTPRGIGAGATEAAVRRAYGSGLQAEPHKYLGLPARYLTFWLNRERGVRFETDERRRVSAIHAGSRSIEYVEGCA